ncbi:flagellin, partial [Falsiroseomonas oryziterrae]|uniref:flagellin n=1 Tax=Falsiroseomonas oryziterrae TaxID=2911368 RepID=UPI001F15A5BE
AATATAATDPATAPFSAHLAGPALTEPRRAVQVADGERVGWGVLASQDADGEVALAWGREVLRGLATLAALTPAAAAQDPGYGELLGAVAGDLSAAGRSLARERGVLGAAEKRVEAARDRHRDVLVTLRAQVVSLEGVDLAGVSATLRATQIRLEASYATTARIAGLSLASLLR